MIILLILAIIGFGVSLYGFFIEQKLKKDTNYKAVCDISERASCTKVLLSDYSKMFGIPNTILGMLFYTVIGIFTLLRLYTIVFLLSLGAVAVTVWLAYILYFRIQTFCFLCTTTYIVNLGLFIISFYKSFGV